MKMCLRALCAVLPLVVLAAQGARAQVVAPTDWYGTLGYSALDGRQVDLSAITGRVGARFGEYFGLEGEVSLGVNHDDFIYVPSCSGPICATSNIAIFISNARLNNAEGLYAVGYLPLTPDIDLFARAGYAYSDYSAAHFLSSGFSQQSFNYGAGGQFFFDGVDGIRFDYTRQDVMDEDSVGRQAVGRDANVWSVSFVRRF